MSSLMHTILAIETSCDETAVAILRGNELLASEVASQREHEAYGGVVPEVASRNHLLHAPRQPAGHDRGDDEGHQRTDAAEDERGAHGLSQGLLQQDFRVEDVEIAPRVRLLPQRNAATKVNHGADVNLGPKIVNFDLGGLGQ